jgi:hypothetical protein
MPRLVVSPNESHHLGLQYGAIDGDALWLEPPVAVSAGHAAFARCIGHVVGAGAEEQMGGVYASRVVAGMADHFVIGNFATMGEIAKAVSHELLASASADSELPSITSTPVPTTSGVIDGVQPLESL